MPLRQQKDSTDTQFIRVNRPMEGDEPFWKQVATGEPTELTEADVDRLLEEQTFEMILQEIDDKISEKKARRQKSLGRDLDADETKDLARDRAEQVGLLRKILLDHARIRTFDYDEIVVRVGDYGSSAFLMLAGSVRVLQVVDPKKLGRQTANRPSLWGAFKRWLHQPRISEERTHVRVTDDDLFSADTESGAKGPRFRNELEESKTIVRVSSPSVTRWGEETENKSTVFRHAGEWIGEIAALSRHPRTATVVADHEMGTTTTMMEIRWQGLHALRSNWTNFKRQIDFKYRERGLAAHLQMTRLFEHVDQAVLEQNQFKNAISFQSYGDFDWNFSYDEIRELSSQERLLKEPVIAAAGHYPNGVYIVRAGFARLSRNYNRGERTISYLGKDQIFGLEEAFASLATKSPVPFRRTLRAVGYVDLLFVPMWLIDKYVFQHEETRARLEAEFENLEDEDANGLDSLDGLKTDFLEFLVENRYINGTQAMLIDMDRCTRCDDCVRACASTHDNNPRFLRHGPIEDRIMIANACMHCIDPVCLIGCPTGAIHRVAADGRVVINDLTCVGCATCANNCPYDNIRMVFPRNETGNIYYAEEDNLPIQKATKCDLCGDQVTGPACVNACPHDAMVRADMMDVPALVDWLKR
ncbi:MAG: 4Fe-4S dicluster domain-containing protein [Verrucomicrobiia bacterium]|jgi:Fe-S-cluster-containing dehydrogenase component/CRP-like cAMP-binding protein